MDAVLLIVDALNLIRRVHAATPEDAEPRHTEAARNATAQSLRRALMDVRPTHVVAVFDGDGSTWRHVLYDDYKAGRKPMPEPLRRDLDNYRAAFSELGVASVSKPALEADDVAATLATKVAARAGRAILLSTDKVYCQLISDDILVRDHFEKQDLDRGYVVRKFGVAPELLVDLWALAGNPSTHIPGVPGIGVKTAARLLDEHGSLEGVLEAAPSIGGKLGERLRANAATARLSGELARLRRDLELGWHLRSFRLARQPGGGPR